MGKILHIIFRLARNDFPMLGTGKLDLRGVKEVAQKFSATDGHR